MGGSDPLVFSDNEDFNAARLNRAMTALALRLKSVEARDLDYAAAIQQLLSIGLVRLDQALVPVFESLVSLSQLGAIFTTTSVSNVAIGAGTKTFLVAADDRERFAAAAFLAATKTADPSRIMYGSLQSYDRETGTLVIRVEEFLGPEAEQVASWTISASAPPDYVTTAHQVGAYTQAEVDAIVAALRGGVAAAGDTLAKLYTSLQALSVSLSQHAASTNNPHAVTKAQVGLSEVDNTSDANKPLSTATATALAGKAASSHTHALSDIANLVTTLANKASLSGDGAQNFSVANLNINGWGWITDLLNNKVEQVRVNSWVQMGMEYGWNFVYAGWVVDGLYRESLSPETRLTSWAQRALQYHKPNAGWVTIPRT